MWIKRKIRNWLNSDESMKGANAIDSGLAVKARSSPDVEGMNFSVYPAEGGYVLEFRYYDRKTDRSSNRLYLIGQDDDFAQRVSQCVMVESMRQ